MRNIIRIAKDDFRLLFKSSISMLVIIGLICVPSIYSWLNLAGCWDPYKNTGDLKVAVVNKDQGYYNKYLPMNINVGESTVAALYENPSFKWVFVEDEDEAVRSLNDGKYYAALVIPEDFSQQMMSILSNKAESAQLIYYSNEKENAIAPKLTGQGANVIQQKINNSFQDTLLQAMLRILTLAADGVQSQDMKQFMRDTSDTFESVSKSLIGTSAQLKSVQTTLTALNDLVDTANNVLPASGTEKEQNLRAILNTVGVDLAKIRQSLDNIVQFIEQHGLSQKAVAVLQELSGLVSQLEQIDNSALKIMDDVGNTTTSLRETLSSLKMLSIDLSSRLNSVCADLEVISGDLSAAKDRINALSQSSTIDDLRQIIGNNSDHFAVLLTSPVKLERTAIYPVSDNGSAMAAFCTSLAIWIGPLLLAAMMKVNISEKRLRKMGNVKRYQMYFGRYITFGFLAFLQSTMVMLGNLFFMQIQCVHPWMFLFTGWILALIFSLLIYTLVVSFANIGKSIAVILLVLQVAGSGGIFPHELLQEFFAKIYPFLPFSWSIDAFHYCIAGFNPDTGIIMYLCLVLLPAIVIIPISLLMGLVLRVPIIRMNTWFINKLEETGVMG